MAQNASRCPHCGGIISIYRNPIPAVDIIVEPSPGKIILIKRQNPPYGWALPGGFVEYGESLEEAAVRELKEETNLTAVALTQLHTYSRPDRDPRFHTVATVFVARAEGAALAADDAAEIGIFSKDALPENIAFDHREIINDYFQGKR